MIKKTITIAVIALLFSSCGTQKKIAGHQNEIKSLTQQVKTLEKENKNLKENMQAFEEQFQENERQMNEMQGGEDMIANAEDGIVLNYAEIMPKFTEEVSLESFIKANYKKPESLKEQGIEGVVYVQFVVEKDGRVTKVKTVRPLQKDLDKEAVRLIKQTKWVPGTIRQEAVRVKMIVPISFE